MEYNQALSTGIPASFEALEERNFQAACYNIRMTEDIEEARAEMRFFDEWFKA